MPDMVNERGVHKIEVHGAELMIADQPQYLYYWQHLQPEQITWESKLSWKVHATIDAGTDLLLGASGAKLVLKPVGVVGKVATTAFVTSILSKAAWKYVKYRGITFGIEEFLETLTREIEKLTKIKEPNTMVTYASFLEHKTIKLPDSLKGIPVVVRWDEGFSSWETADAFHLASPCYIDYLRGYQKYDVKCEKYEYDAKTGYTQCFKPSVKEWKYHDEPECTLSLRGVSDYYLELGDSRIDTNPMSVLMEEEAQDVLDHMERGTNYDYEVYKNTVDSPRPFSNGVADTIKIEYGSKKEYIVDSNFDGYFDTFVVENCRIPGIVVSDIHKKDTGDKYNYCLNQEGWGHTVLNVMGWVAIGAGVVTTIVITAGGAAPAYIAAVALGTGATAGALEATGDYYEQQGDWPGAEGPNLDISP
jgi:hypothetical protein